MPFEVLRNDITRVKADAIVNTANPRPVIGYGTDRAIHQQAGQELLEARKQIGDIKPGHAAATPAFGLPAKYVLHTVSPAWRGGQQGEAKLLRQAYDAALTLAAELGCSSVAFPLMAAGSYGFPKELALSTAIGAFTDFLLSHRMHIYLVLFNGRAFSLAGGLFPEVRSYIDHHYVEELTRQEYPAGEPEERIRPEETFHGLSAMRPADQAWKLQRSELQTAKIAAPDDLQAALKQSGETFSAALQRLLRERKLKDSDVYRSCQMSRQTFNKIVSGKSANLKKTSALQIALGLRLDIAETRDLLAKAGYSLSESSGFDLAVEYFIRHGEYNLVRINIALADNGLEQFSLSL